MGNSAVFGTTQNFLSSLCAKNNAKEVLDPLLSPMHTARDLAITGAVFCGLGLDFYHAGLFSSIAAALGLVIDLIEGIEKDLGDDAPLGDFMVALLNAAVDAGLLGVIPQVEEYLFNSLQPPVDRTAVSYAVLDTHDYTDRNCTVSADSLEVAFDASTPQAASAGFIPFVDQLFDRMNELNDGTLAPPGRPAIGKPLAFAGYVSVRFTAQTRALIGMQQWPTTCHIEIAAPGGLEGNEPFLARLEADAIALGAKVHWGQKNDLTADQVEAMYPQLDAWRAVLTTVTANGELPTFSTAFTRQRGLEVMKPFAQDPFVDPLFECSPAEVAMARPGLGAQTTPSDGGTTRMRAQSISRTTTARLGSVGFIKSSAMLGGSAAGQRGAMRARSSLLGADSYFARKDDRYAMWAAADCEYAQGKKYWVADFYLPKAQWSWRLQPAMLWLGGTSPAVVVSKEGAPDVQLDAKGAGVKFPVPTQMAGHWRLRTPGGCGGRPPTLGIEILVQCV